MKTVAFLNALRSRLASELNVILDRGERRTDGCVTALEEDTVRHNAKRINSIDAELAQLRAHPTTKGRRRRTTSELRKELQKEQRLTDPEPRPAGRSYCRRSAVHEAAHAVCFEARGVRVLSVTLDECRPEKHDAVGALCGAIAAQRIGFDDAYSPSDMAMAKQALLGEGKSEQWMSGAEGDAQRLVAGCWPVIQGVAAALYHRGQLTGHEVRAVMRQTAWVLQEQDRHSLQHAYAQRTARLSAW